MKQHRQLASCVLAVLFLQGCATLQPGADPVVVRAEQTTQLAMDTFNLVEKTEFDVYPTLKSYAPSMATEVRTYVNKIRKNQYDWLKTTRALTAAYKHNRTPENKATLETAIAVLVSAIAESNKYIAAMATTHAWMSYHLSENFNQRR